MNSDVCWVLGFNEDCFTIQYPGIVGNIRKPGFRLSDFGVIVNMVVFSHIAVSGISRRHEHRCGVSHLG